MQSWHNSTDSWLLVQWSSAWRRLSMAIRGLDGCRSLNHQQCDSLQFWQGWIALVLVFGLHYCHLPFSFTHLLMVKKQSSNKRSKMKENGSRTRVAGECHLLGVIAITCTVVVEINWTCESSFTVSDIFLCFCQSSSILPSSHWIRLFVRNFFSFNLVAAYSPRWHHLAHCDPFPKIKSRLLEIECA